MLIVDWIRMQKKFWDSLIILTFSFSLSFQFYFSDHLIIKKQIFCFEMMYYTLLYFVYFSVSYKENQIF